MHDSPLLELLKDWGDAASCAVVLATLAKILPAVAALFTITWTGIRIYEWWKHRNGE